MAGRVIRTGLAAALGAAALLVGTQPDAASSLAAALVRAGGALAGGSEAVAPGLLTEASAPALSPRLRSAASYAPPEGLFVARTVDGGARRWWSLPGEAPRPDRAALVLLHGSGRDGRAMLDMWRDLGPDAPLLIAPDSLDPAGWTWRADGPAFLDAVLADAQEAYGFDPDRVYLFGHSAGGGHALRLANAEGGPWRAAATHAGASRPWDARPRPDAPPLRLYAGALDVTVPPDAVRAAAEALARSGHRVELVTIPRHDHWYYAIGPRLARDAWSFLSSQ